MPLIAGEIKRFLRDNGAIKVSRILKQNGYQISKAKEALLHKYGREATLDELADYTGLCVEDIVMATEANREVESIQQTICGKDGTQISLVERLVDEAQSEVAAENIMNRILVGQAMEKLGEMEQELIRLRFFEDKTQTEVAKVLGISQVQVSRLEKKILIQMRQNLDLYKYELEVRFTYKKYNTRNKSRIIKLIVEKTYFTLYNVNNSCIWRESIWEHARSLRWNSLIAIIF